MGLDAEAAASREVRELEAAGVDIQRVPLRRGPVFENRTTAHGRTQVAHQVSDSMAPDALPAAWRATCSMLLNPVAGEIGDEWAGAVPDEALMALDCQGLVRSLFPGREVEALPLVAGPLTERADLISVSSEDARGGGAPLREILGRDGAELVVRHGERGSLRLYRRQGTVRMDRFPIIPALRQADATGAGDSFLAAWLVGRLALRSAGAPADDHRAIHLAALAATLIVEGERIDRDAVRRRVTQRATGSPTKTA